MATPDMVVMIHPDVAVPSGATSRKAYEELYRPLGWRLADESAERSPEVTDDQTEPGDEPEIKEW